MVKSRAVSFPGHRVRPVCRIKSEEEAKRERGACQRWMLLFEDQSGFY